MRRSMAASVDIVEVLPTTVVLTCWGCVCLLLLLSFWGNLIKTVLVFAFFFSRFFLLTDKKNKP